MHDLKISSGTILIMQKKKSNGSDLRCRTLTPSNKTKMTGGIRELDEEYDDIHVAKKSSFIQLGLTAENLEQLDIANNKLMRRTANKSPSKIMQKYVERQQRAENLRQ